MQTKEQNILSALWFIPSIAFAYYFNVWTQLIILIFVMFFSILHLQQKIKIIIFLDILFAWLLIFTNFILLILGNFKFPYFEIATIFAVVAIYLFKNKRENKNYYNLWHFLSALISICSLLAFTT